MKAAIQFLVAAWAVISVARADHTKPANVMTTATSAALVLSDITAQMAEALTPASAEAAKLRDALAQTAGAALYDNSQLGTAAIPVAIVLSKQLTAWTQGRLELAPRLIRAVVKLDNLSGHQFGAALMEDLRIPDIDTGNADPQTAAAWSNLYVTAGTNTYSTAAVTAFDKKRTERQKMAAARELRKLKYLPSKSKAQGRPRSSSADNRQRTKRRRQQVQKRPSRNNRRRRASRRNLCHWRNGRQYGKDNNNQGKQ
uniref:Variant surface glycoprotein 1125.1623 n=1 Tax=Trypanosoma brucei TaxID=5691 RepID=A0A1J0R7Q1_9TRYP|nr:variant surface glycoprotein 1125.1623 [Trypanosoma brucei]